MNHSRRRFLRYLLVSASACLLARFVYADDDDVPFFSQEDWSAPSGYDCGESCFRMLLLWRANALGIDPYTVMSVDAISALWGKPLGELSWADVHMYPHLADMGFTGELSMNADADWYRAQIEAGYPCVALVTYGGFEPHNRANSTTGGHYVVVVGYDIDGFVINDPAWWDERDGANRPISAREWLYSSQGVGISITGFVSSAYDA